MRVLCSTCIKIKVDNVSCFVKISLIRISINQKITKEVVMADQATLPSVGSLKIPGKTILFCNGIMNDEKAAEESAGLISEVFGGRQVFYYHNPTGLKDYFSFGPENIHEQVSLAAGLAREINSFINTDLEKGKLEPQRVCVALFVHSHGAVIAKSALEVLSKFKSYIRVYAFGGAALIPNSLAQKVQNYMFDEDIIAEMGNIKSEDEKILRSVKEIKEIAAREKQEEVHAIYFKAYKDLYLYLCPFLSLRINATEDWETKKDKDERYQKVFEQRDEEALFSDPYLIKRVKKYSCYFEDYNIVFIKGTVFQHPEYDELKKHSSVKEFFFNIPENVCKGWENIGKGLLAVGCYALENHLFSAYRERIHEAASFEMQEDLTQMQDEIHRLQTKLASKQT